MIRLALTKGRIEEKAVKMLESAGYDISPLRDKGRKLLFGIGGGVTVVLAKAADVITYVSHGVCDAGVVGEDTIMEHSSNVCELLDLGFGKCRFALAGPKGGDFYGGYSHKVIASKYPEIAKNCMRRRGVDVEVVKIEGSVELAPILGLSDAIIDIVETGKTLEENGLEVYEDIAYVSARFIANQASLKLKKNEIDILTENFRRQINA